jgi:hypothetical protein
MHGFNWQSEFVVVSYSTPIAYIRRDCTKAYLNVKKYSVTTSKQQTYVRQALAKLRYLHPSLEVVEYRDYSEIVGR